MVPHKKIIFLVLALIYLFNAVATRQSMIKLKQAQMMKNKISEKLHSYKQQQYLFDQIVDHSSYQNQTTWKQRYWVVDNYFEPQSGPVYLFICGEYICEGIRNQRQWIVTLAQRTKGLILVLQHRFYGQSLPFGNQSLSIQNMKYLTSQQALSDLAYFQKQITVNHMYDVNQNPWIAVGGSYPGSLSAWYRYKYSHLVIGALASSAVVQSIQDMKQFDEQIYLSAKKSGDYCWNAINISNYQVQKILQNQRAGAQFRSNFAGSQRLKIDQFMFYWIDSIVFEIQYGNRVKFCNNLNAKSWDEQFKYLISIVKTNSAYQYGSYYLANQTWAMEDGQGMRAWYYQSCSEFGYWQTPSLKHPLRSPLLSLDFYKRFCFDLYGFNLWPKVDRKNTETGGWHLAASNLLISNGDQDPWKWASVLQSQNEDIIARVANCDDCAHCADLHTPTLADAPELKKIRDQQYLTITQWISNYWQKKFKQAKIPKKVSLIKKSLYLVISQQ